MSTTQTRSSSTVSPEVVTARAKAKPASGFTLRVARRLVMARLRRLEVGSLKLQLTPECASALDCPMDVTLGALCADGLSAHLEVVDGRFWTSLASGGALGAAEAYAEGWWRSKNLSNVIRLLARNREVLQQVDSGLAKLGAPLLRRWHQARRNTHEGSRKNIAAHYDLSNEFFALFLDPTMTYSCALFQEPTMTLEQAQVAKIDHLCQKLGLDPGVHLLEIGTGWGAFARHAAKEYGCKVTTTTISQEQHAYAAALLEREGLTSQVELLLKDYRQLEGTYDRVVSVEMVEAVGADFLGEYFETIGRLLKPDGMAAVQAITIQDQEFLRASKHIDFIKRYIFPGSCIPSVTAMCDAMTAESDLKLAHLEDFTADYATTLTHWREAFLSKREELHAMGLGEHFQKTWEYYFSYCEGGFAERSIGLVQMMLTKPGCNYRTP
ncbi:MAG: class I SAM-dependent methyltransferase [Planctomycetes bacterium]|nr:class I SAM-dependent methyltransferase [Planctomycetota bacterium]